MSRYTWDLDKAEANFRKHGVTFGEAALMLDGRSGSISAGPRLEGFARLNNGEPHRYPSRAPRHSGTRVAEGAA